MAEFPGFEGEQLKNCFDKILKLIKKNIFGVDQSIYGLTFETLRPLTYL